MRFITEYTYATTPEQNAQSIRNIVDGLYDGQHDVNFNSASIGSAYISNLIVGSGVFSAGSFDFTRLSGVTLYAQSGNLTDSTFESSLITSANITSMTLGYSPRISAATIYGVSGNFFYASLASANIITANIGSAYITSGTFVGLSSTIGTIATLGSTSATIQTLQNAGYGNFASANITTALIASATITSATITGAKIGTLQGLLLGTAGVVSAVASGTTAQYLRGDVSWQTTPTGDVTAAANMTDHTIIRGDGGAKGVQDTGITIDDSDNIVGGSYAGAIVDKSIEIIRKSNGNIVDNDSDSLVFSFIPSKILLRFTASAAYTGTVENAATHGDCLITITGTDTFTSNLNAITWQWRANTSDMRATNNLEDTTNVVKWLTGRDSAGAEGTVTGTATWTTSTKTLLITYQETSTTTAQNLIILEATAYK